MNGQWQSILRFMQEEDPNGDWLSLPHGEEGIVYVYDTIMEWLTDGLDETPRVNQMLEWLSK
jgi:hypothetical protein